MATVAKHTILFVDDERDNVDALERIFRKKYNCLKATSAAEGLNLLKTNDVSLIISDQRMPNMTGVEMLEKSLEHRPDAVRILLTGYTDIESVIAAVNSGQIYRYVTKPWDPRDLEVTVDRAIERYEMAHELKAKNEALERALRELKTLDESKSHFMILVNHELKTPLTTLISYLDLLKETKLDDEQKLFTNRISTSCERLKELIYDVLEFVSAETGQTKLAIKKQKIKPALEGVIEDLAEEAKKKGQKIKIEDAKEDLTFDSQQLKNILSRLLHNAIKFGDADSTIKIKSENVDKAHTRVIIENKGKPLTKATVDKILRPFALDENIMNHSKGIGMGLSISQALLKLHGSRLEFESEDSTVRVSFTLEK